MGEAGVVIEKYQNVARRYPGPVISSACGPPV